MPAKTLTEKIEQLPPELQEEVEEFVQSLVENRQGSARKTPRFHWAGALKDLRTQYTSVELQHKANEWRAGIWSDRK